MNKEHLQYLSDAINSLIDDRSKMTETDTKPAMLLPNKRID